MSKSVEAWKERAEYDLETARAMLEAGRFLYVLFCCQQAIEKALKALIVERSGELPPRIHSLLRLADTAGVTVPVERRPFLRELTAYSIQSRYPEEIPTSGTAIPRETAERILKQTEAELQWLLSMLT